MSQKLNVMYVYYVSAGRFTSNKTFTDSNFGFYVDER